MSASNQLDLVANDVRNLRNIAHFRSYFRELREQKLGELARQLIGNRSLLQNYVRTMEPYVHILGRVRLPIASEWAPGYEYPERMGLTGSKLTMHCHLTYRNLGAFLGGPHSVLPNEGFHGHAVRTAQLQVSGGTEERQGRIVALLPNVNRDQDALARRILGQHTGVLLPPPAEAVEWMERGITEVQRLYLGFPGGSGGEQYMPVGMVLVETTGSHNPAPGSEWQLEPNELHSVAQPGPAPLRDGNERPSVSLFGKEATGQSTLVCSSEPLSPLVQSRPLTLLETRRAFVALAHELAHPFQSRYDIEPGTDARPTETRRMSLVKVNRPQEPARFDAVAVRHATGVLVQRWFDRLEQMAMSQPQATGTPVASAQEAFIYDHLSRPVQRSSGRDRIALEVADVAEQARLSLLAALTRRHISRATELPLTEPVMIGLKQMGCFDDETGIGVGYQAVVDVFVSLGCSQPHLTEMVSDLVAEMAQPSVRVARERIRQPHKAPSKSATSRNKRSEAELIISTFDEVVVSLTDVFRMTGAAWLERQGLPRDLVDNRGKILIGPLISHLQSDTGTAMRLMDLLERETEGGIKRLPQAVRVSQQFASAFAYPDRPLILVTGLSQRTVGAIRPLVGLGSQVKVLCREQLGHLDKSPWALMEAARVMGVEPHRAGLVDSNAERQRSARLLGLGVVNPAQLPVNAQQQVAVSYMARRAKTDRLQVAR